MGRLGDQVDAMADNMRTLIPMQNKLTELAFQFDGVFGKNPNLKSFRRPSANTEPRG